MCGILGIFGPKATESTIKKGITCLIPRGKDNQDIIKVKNGIIGHTLHSIVSFVKQPFVGEGVFVGNTEIYNWEKLAEKHGITAKNDSDLVFQLLESGLPIKLVTNLLDGVYAFAYYRDDVLYLARDLVGVKPIWYSEKPFAFASERKALEKMGFSGKELNPRQILEYDVKSKKIKLVKRAFFTTAPEHRQSETFIQGKTQELLTKAVWKRLPEKKFGLLFSGGVDSSVLAQLLKAFKQPFTCYTVVVDHPSFQEPHDLEAATKTAKALGLDHKILKISQKEIEKMLPIVIPLIEDNNVQKVSVALTFFKAVEEAAKDGCKVLFSGLGAEELFAGYKRHKSSLQLNKECLSGFRKMYERDLYRDDVITMFHSVELRLPFLDRELIEYSLKIPPSLKINGEKDKLVLRKIAEEIGISHETAYRKKRAAQYGSNVQKALKKLASNHESVSAYVDTFSKRKNPRLGALLSSGKDSVFAMYSMMVQNYPIECLITLKSNNPDSYMFHTPTINLVKEQSKSMKIPLIEQETKGVKEKELTDLRKALQKAKEKYGIEGVVTGAIRSNYQRDRIEKVCDGLSLKIFAPLWHIDQEKYMRNIINKGFSFIMTKVAAEGLDKSWLGREITNKDIDNLVKLHSKNKIEIAGEGGEFETLMVDGPIFDKKIKVKVKEIIEDEGSWWIQLR
tara:strand:- start:7885 stop:9921 length:2037 start_codon:yes stop_codon:yes gene_type:complete